MKAQVLDLKASSSEFRCEVSARLDALEDDLRPSSRVSERDASKAAYRLVSGDGGLFRSSGQHASLSQRALTPTTSTTASQVGELGEHSCDWDIVESVKHLKHEVPMLAKATALQEVSERLEEERSSRRVSEAFF